MVQGALSVSRKSDEVSLTVSYGTKIPDYVTFTIRDSGRKISPAAQKNLFKSVSDIKPEDLMLGKASNMGLSICTDIVKMHKGSIGYEAAPTTSWASADNEWEEFFFSIAFEECEEADIDRARDDVASRARRGLDELVGDETELENFLDDEVRDADGQLLDKKYR